MRKNNRLILVVLPALLLISWHGVARAMGKRPGQGRAAAVSRLTPEQELRAKAEFDSLMAIYDPWEAIIKDQSQEESLKSSGKSKKNLFDALAALDEKYRGSLIGDAILSRLIILHISIRPRKDIIIEGERYAKHNPKYDEHYRETMGYTLRFVDEYPKSPYAEKVLLHFGGQYAGGLEEKYGKYIKPYVEYVKRYPRGRFVSFVLYVISASAEYDSGGDDFETRMWAYTLWRKKYDDKYFYINLYDDPKLESIYNNPINISLLLKQTEDEKQEVGKGLLLLIAPSIGHAMAELWDKNGSYPIVNTSNVDVLYNKLSPYCWEDDIFKRYNPFKQYPELKLLNFKSESLKYKYKLKLFDIEIEEGSDRTVPRPKR